MFDSSASAPQFVHNVIHLVFELVDSNFNYNLKRSSINKLLVMGFWGCGVLGLL